MSDKRLYVEGGGDSKELHARCREGFRKLLEAGGLKGRVPRIVASGSRNEAYDAFKTAQESGPGDYVALIVDSEDAVADPELPWAHLKARDGWDCPVGARDEQVFLMTTCMETWIVADRASLKKHYGSKFREASLPPLNNLEGQHRHDVQGKLETATSACTNAYKKGKRSFDALASVDPTTLRATLPAFARMMRILEAEL